MKALIFAAAAACCAAGAAYADCTLAKLAEFPVKQEGLRSLVSANVEGVDTMALVDTGAYASSIFRPLAKRASMRIVQDMEFAAGLGGEVRVDAAIASKLQLGDFDLGHIILRVDEQQELPRLHDARPPIGILLGRDAFNNKDVEIDFFHGPESAIRVFDLTGSCANYSPVYWAKDWIEATMPPPPPDEEHPAIRIDIKVNGAPMHAIIDTGAETSALDVRAAARAGVTPQSPGVIKLPPGSGLGSQTVSAWRAHFDKVEIGEEAINGAYLAIVQPSHMGMGLMTDMLLGQDFLRAHRVFVDYRARKVYLTYRGGPVFFAPLPSQVAPARPSAP